MADTERSGLLSSGHASPTSDHELAEKISEKINYDEEGSERNEKVT